MNIGEHIKGATILEPVKGIHNAYILDIDASEVYKLVLQQREESESKDKWKEFDLIEWLQEKLEQINFIKNYKPKILYGDADFLHIETSELDEDTAIEIGTKLCKELNNKLIFNLVVHEMDGRRIKLRGVADSVYYKAKKRYLIKYVWMNGHKVDCIKVKGVNNIDLLDLSSKVEWR